MNLRIAVTDNDWFEFLRRQPELDEVNFWQPSGGRSFRALDVGEPFLFKLHSPLNFIVGGGFFAHFSIIPCSLAWKAFGPKNGASSFTELRQRIEKYRRVPADLHEDWRIGCIILSEPFFLNEEEWIAVPKDFPMTVQQGKNYDMTTPPGEQIWEAVQATLPSARAHNVTGEVRWSHVTSRRRLGQGAFQVYVTDAYNRRCAVTREKALPVLEAAHIRPVTQGGTHDARNGLLLRRDLHALFDQGYVTVGGDLRLRVSRRLKKEFDDGEYYTTFECSELGLPREAADRPDPGLLEWHTDTVFKG